MIATSDKIDCGLNHMEKSKDNRIEKSPEDIFARYLKSLHLHEEDLRDKKILDVGAGTGGFAKAVIEKGLSKDIVSIDRLPQTVRGPDESPVIIASAQEMPFADNSFDYVVSVDAMPHTAFLGQQNFGEAARASVADAIRECVRVVKKGGEIRFGGVPRNMQSYVQEGVEDGIKGIAKVVGDSDSEDLMIIEKL
jgi:ubiquinone/menaquinone biosynthesis C-methylase UbiE